MIVQSPFRHAARVEMHLPLGFTQVILFELGDRRWEIPTDRIPLQLQRIGSELFVVMPRFTVETSDTPASPLSNAQLSLRLSSLSRIQLATV
jgi:hypothetical protein